MNTVKPFERSPLCRSPTRSISWVTSGRYSWCATCCTARSTYGELALSPERIPTNILADRLDPPGKCRHPDPLLRIKIVRCDILTELTPKGRALGDVLLAFVRWGEEHIPGTVTLKGVPWARSAGPLRSRVARA